MRNRLRRLEFAIAAGIGGIWQAYYAVREMKKANSASALSQAGNDTLSYSVRPTGDRRAA